MSLESGARPLQFDTAKRATTQPGAAAAGGATCAVCNALIATEYYEVNSQTVCSRCQQEVAKHAEVPAGFGVFARALLYGFGAAILGAILYYAVVKITNFEIGIVAIAIGFMVGYAIRTATGNRGGLRYQLLAIGLTYWAVGMSFMPFVFEGIKEKQAAAAKQLQSAPAQAATASATEPTPDTTPTEEVKAETAQAAAGDKPVGPLGFLIAIGALLALSLTLPVLAAFGSMPGGLISLAIVAFGMQQAWRMTGAPRLVITGPYRIVRAAAS